MLAVVWLATRSLELLGELIFLKLINHCDLPPILLYILFLPKLVTIALNVRTPGLFVLIMSLHFRAPRSM